MKLYLLAALGGAALLFAAPAQAQPDVLFYTTLNRAVHLGQYDGVMTVRDFKKNGDFGLGSIDKLKYELIYLDGTPYGFSADGEAITLPDDARVVFGVTKHFKAQKTIELSEKLSLKKLQAVLDTLLDHNAFAAIKITGTFDQIKYFCYEEQQKPYKPTRKIGKKNFERSGVEGTIVGFFTPRSAEVLNSPNYHFHFTTQNRDGGGHVDDCRIGRVRIEIDYAEELRVHLPEPRLQQNIDLNKPIK
ncbi:acetolactate decarboxylase [Rhabdobacter roseus]|uniref:Alpha-acetolactate decarboxylase n=1 Tax=Rhabdobacter roseus TaxID=1655419 RepID=A0A840THD0_9BACT|nr:acetolactate decarboxylase [Rhabdobacter roseus]MBB5282864.1 acetolactate decarboxylase [Rhabdobacter roseus]